MRILSGVSQRQDGQEAMDEICQSWPQEAPSMILMFHSTKQSSKDLVKALAGKYPGVPVAGCTSSGEHLNGQHYRGAVVLSALWTPEVRGSVGLLRDIDQLDRSKAVAAVQSLAAGLDGSVTELSPERNFCLTFIDGLSLAEESVSALVSEALEGVPLLGGSAGDDLKFARTEVIANEEVASNAAVLVLAESEAPFEILKHQHFLRRPEKLAVTRVDVKHRRVYELDGLPAKLAYANALGIDPDKLTDEQCFLNPLIFRANNELYIRSIQRIEDDDSIIFYCGVEEGMVLELGGHEEIEQALKQELPQQEKSTLLLACNCILRALETDQEAKHEELGRILQASADTVIGFDTYGEQLNGLHINQTLVGLRLGRAA